MGVKVREKPKGSGVFWIFINHNGKRKAKEIGKDKRLAREVAKKIEAKLVLGEMNLEKTEPPCPTFKEYAEKWLALPQDWKDSTRASYVHNLNLHVYPVLGNKQINEIKRKDIKTFFDDLAIRKLSKGTIKTIRAPINGVLSHALDTELVEINPLTGLKLGSNRRRFEVNPYTEKEVALFLENTQKFLDGYYYAHFLCKFRTGLRLGELRALKWKDINFQKRQIEVKRSYRRKIISLPKNGRPRFVDMTPHLTETLKIWRTRQKELALKHGRPFSEWVFVNNRGNIFTWIALNNALYRISKAAGLRKIRIHDIRHTYATVRLLKGHNIGDDSKQLGHSSIKITFDIYGHWIPGSFKSEVDELDQAQPDATYTQPVKKV